MFGALLEVELRKICTTLRRENDLEAKTVKTPGALDIFGGPCQACTSPWWTFKLRFAWQAQGFWHVAKTWQAQEFARVAETLAGVVGLKSVRNDAFRVAGAKISCFVMSMFEASDAESVEEVANFVQQKCYSQQGSFREQECICLGATFAWQAQYF